MTKKEEAIINGVKYVKADSISKQIEKNKEGLTRCIIRTYSAGVFYGLVNYESPAQFSVEIYESVRIWKWNGAFTLSNLATEGTKEPENCRFAISVNKMKVNRWAELLPLTEKAYSSLEEVEKE